MAIDWNILNKGRAKRVSNYDVTLHLNASKDNKSRQLSVRFYNDAYKKITDTGCVRSGLDDPKRILYFKGVSKDDENGRKLNGDKNKEIKITIYPDYYTKWEFLQGSYHLYFDEQEKLYYINLNEKG